MFLSCRSLGTSSATGMAWITCMILQGRGRMSRLQRHLTINVISLPLISLSLCITCMFLIHFIMSLSSSDFPGIRPIAEQRMTHRLVGAQLASCGRRNKGVSQIFTKWEELLRAVGWRWHDLAVAVAVVQGGLVVCNDLPALEEETKETRQESGGV